MINQERRFSLGIVVDLHPWIVSIACSKHFRDGRGAANEARGTIVYHGKVGRLHKTWKRFPVTILSAIDRCAGLRGYGEDTARATRPSKILPFPRAVFHWRGKSEATIQATRDTRLTRGFALASVNWNTKRRLISKFSVESVFHSI